MTIVKRPICPDRIRRVPEQFSWVDHRLIRERYIDHCSHQASALYLFLVTVGDASGLSYYSDATLGQRLTMDETVLRLAREELVRLELIAYAKPLYQVLALELRRLTTERRGEAMSVGQILERIREQNR